MMTPDDAIISRILFHPRKEGPGYVPQGIRTATRSGKVDIGGYLHLHPTSAALLLFFHGNGEIAADYDDIAPFFTGCGVSFWIVDYRGYGRSTGLPAYSHMFEDAKAILDDLPRMAQTVGRRFSGIVLMGRSLGSASAIFLASRQASASNGLILDSPYAHGLKLIGRLGGIPLHKGDVPEFSDNIDMASAVRLPTLILHGTADAIIPVSDARSLYRSLGSSVKRLVEIEGAGHNDLMPVGAGQYWSSIKTHLLQAVHGAPAL